MGINKRWGEDRKYPRDWPKYNEELVKRGTFFFHVDFMKKELLEIEQMNKNKVGRPYEYSNSFIEFQARLHSWLDYRGIEGFTRAIAKYVPGMKANSFSDICRRVNALDLRLEMPEGEHIYAAYDSTGIKVSNRGEWMRQKWGVRRGWIKVGIVVDTKSKKLLDIEVTTEKDGCDGEVLIRQINRLRGVDIDKLSADGALDRRDIFNKLAKEGIEPAIKIRKNASTKARGSLARSKEVRRYKELGYEQWAKEKEYGQRWDSEGKFSAVKRKFGETVRATKPENMLKEARMKFILYERMRNYAKA